MVRDQPDNVRSVQDALPIIGVRTKLWRRRSQDAPIFNEPTRWAVCPRLCAQPTQKSATESRSSSAAYTSAHDQFLARVLFLTVFRQTIRHRRNPARRRNPSANCSRRGEPRRGMKRMSDNFVRAFGPGTKPDGRTLVEAAQRLIGKIAQNRSSSNNLCPLARFSPSTVKDPQSPRSLRSLPVLGAMPLKQRIVLCGEWGSGPPAKSSRLS